MSKKDYGRWMSAFREDDTGVQRSFDDLASALASENISRGRALKLAGASLLGAAGLLGSANAAQAVPTCPRTGPPISSCDRRCRNTRKVCFCIRTVSGAKRCVYPCCSGRTCSSSGQCLNGEVCMRSPCCSATAPTCVKLCSLSRPSYCPTATARSAGGSAWS